MRQGVKVVVADYNQLNILFPEVATKTAIRKKETSPNLPSAGRVDD